MNITIELARLILPYLAFAAPAAVLIGVLNANRHFANAAFAPAIFNLTLLIAIGIMFWFHSGDSIFSVRIIAGAVALAGISQLLLMGIGILHARTRVTPISISFGPQIRGFFALAIPGILASGIPQLTVIAGVMVASTSRGSVSWIYYAHRLIELPLGIVGIAIGTVLVPSLVYAVRNGDKQELIHVESRGLELAFGVTLPAAIALFALAEPIVRVLFERGAFQHTDTTATASALAAFALGLPGHVLVKAFSPAFFAREDTNTPMHAALAGFTVAILGSLVLTPMLGHVGIALSIAASGWVSAVILGCLIARRHGFGLDPTARQRLKRIALSALLMGLAVEYAQPSLTRWLGDAGTSATRATALAGLIMFGFGTYVLLLRVFRVTSPREWIRAIGG